ncbi:hypothetical protein [Macrococcoides caseolyticum]|uniref:hypothetical protein n=1 Tax=Macrococcoides caseolyticum TaxID=69966 RepID=UPI0012FECADB|nr:hypothetical protein [Macrococcus caseolyticus]
MITSLTKDTGMQYLLYRIDWNRMTKGVSVFKSIGDIFYKNPFKHHVMFGWILVFYIICIFRRNRR